jgi:hypothetical protein
MSRSETGIKGPPADFGEHTAEVLAALLGLTDAEVAGLVERGVVMTEGGPDIASLLA